MDRFSKYNPNSTFLFFLFAFVLTVVIMHPLYLAVSLLCAFLYNAVLSGSRAVSLLLKFILPLVMFVAVFNFAFSHYGDTQLFYLFGIAFTLESLVYGLCQGLMLGSMALWFSNYSRVITSERLLCVFGKFAPNTALLLSSVFSFIPRLENNYKQISDARLNIDSKKSKLMRSVNIFSAVVTMTLEQSVTLGDSMKARGFSSKRRAYSKYRFNIKDLALIVFTGVTAVVVIAFKLFGKLYFYVDPVVETAEFNALPFVFYLIFLLMPVIIDGLENIRWNVLKQKI